MDELTLNSKKRLFSLLDEFDAEAEKSRVSKKVLDFGNFCWSCGSPLKKPPDLEFGGLKMQKTNWKK